MQKYFVVLLFSVVIYVDASVGDSTDNDGNFKLTLNNPMNSKFLFYVHFFFVVPNNI